MVGPFEPAAHPALADLDTRLRAEAGDAAYAVGRDYLRKGLVTQATVAGTVAYATVTGSTAYRVTIAFGEQVKPTCTCPAHRRKPYCKHVVAVCVALLERPGEFTAVEPAPAPKKPAREARPKAGSRVSAKEKQAALRAEGLATVDRLLAELADGGLPALGPEKIALLAGAAELVRALKLRRLGNLIAVLQRAAGREGELGTTAFADLLIDLHLARRAAGAFLEERATVEPRLAEELLGKTWRDQELEAVAGLELMALAATTTREGDFRIETIYLADLATGTIYIDRQITPMQLGAAGKTAPCLRLLIDEAGLYPGIAPRRLKPRRTRRAPLRADDVERLLTHALTDLGTLWARLSERLRLPFGPEEAAVLFRPAALVQQGELASVHDGVGAFLPLAWPPTWTAELPPLLPEREPYALFGLLRLEADGPRLRPLSVISTGLHWGRGPVYPELS